MRYLAVALVLLTACASVAFAQEGLKERFDKEKVSLNVKDAPLGQALLTLAKSHPVSIILDPMAQVDDRPAGDVRVTLSADQVPMTQCVNSLVRPLWLDTRVKDGALFISDDGHLAALEPWPHDRRDPGPMDPGIPADVLARLGEIKVTKIGPAPLRTVTQAAVQSSGFKLRYDLLYHAAGDGPVTVFAVQDLPLTRWLNWVARMEGFGWTVEGDTLVITDRAKGSDFVLERKLRDRKVSFVFKDQPVREAVEYLGTVLNLNIVLDLGAMKDPRATVTLAVKDEPAGKAIEQVAGQLGLCPFITQEVIVLTARERGAQFASPAPSSGTWVFRGRATAADLAVKDNITKEVVTVNFQDVLLKEVVDQLGQMGKVKVVLIRNARLDPEQTIMLKLTNVSLKTTLMLFAEQLCLKCSIVDGKVLIADEAAIRQAVAKAGGK